MSTVQTTTDVTSNSHSKKPKTSTTESPPNKALSPALTPGKARILQKPPQAVLQKKVPRRSSKPIINWLQRKLAGSGKAKRTENHPLVPSQVMMGRPTGRIASSPLPVVPAQQLKQTGKADSASLPKRKTRSIFLDGDDEVREVRRQSNGVEDDVSDQLSLNRESIWSPTSAFEADDDASVRPLPPSSPPSPSPSRDSSSYLSNPRTFRSVTASTKPTTLLSIDLNGNGMAHIAQVPSSPAQIYRLNPHVRQSSLTSTGVLNTAGSITFSTVPSPPTSSSPSSLLVNLNDVTPSDGPVSPLQAPLHTTPHPRNNPRPSSPPLDNASVLTLASSAFALSNRPGVVNYAPSAVGDSISHYGGSIVFLDGESTSQYVPGDDERLEERDIDASVRALRPRSSRRGSWESEASRWSARDQFALPSFARERGLHASSSIRTGAFSAFSAENAETLEDRTPETATREIESDKGSLLEPERGDDSAVAAAADTSAAALPGSDTQGDSADDQLRCTSTDTIAVQTSENITAA